METRRDGGRSGRPAAPLWWALVFGALSTVGLGALALGLLVMHGLMYGTLAVIGPEVRIPPPGGDRYPLAFAAGVMANVTVGVTLMWLALRSRARTWSPVLLGLSVALVAGLAAASVLLLVLGINPLDFVAAL